MPTMQRPFLVLAASLLAASAMTQTTPHGQPLNLKLPPASDLPAAGSSAAAKPASTVTKPTSTATKLTSRSPGVYYGDTSGSMGNTRTAMTLPGQQPACDDSTYNQAQIHGDVGMGVMAGNHMSGTYQSGAVDITKAFGSCDDPKGGISFSIGVGQGQFHGRGW